MNLNDLYLKDFDEAARIFTLIDFASKEIESISNNKIGREVALDMLIANLDNGAITNHCSAGAKDIILDMYALRKSMR